MNGIILPDDRPKAKKVSSSLSNRMLDLVQRQKRRILVFKNGNSSDGVEIVANRFDEVSNMLYSWYFYFILNPTGSTELILVMQVPK